MPARPSSSSTWSSTASTRGWCGPATSLRQPAFQRSSTVSPRDGLPNADRVMEHGVVMPCHHGIDDDDAHYIADTALGFCRPLRPIRRPPERCAGVVATPLSTTPARRDTRTAEDLNPRSRRGHGGARPMVAVAARDGRSACASHGRRTGQVGLLERHRAVRPRRFRPPGQVRSAPSTPSRRVPALSLVRPGASGQRDASGASTHVGPVPRVAWYEPDSGPWVCPSS